MTGQASETQSLLPGQLVPIEPTNVGSDSTFDEEELFGLNDESSPIDQLMVLIRQSIPVVISYFLSVSGSFIIMIFAGRYEFANGDKSVIFAGISLANMFANVSCLSIIIGMSSAVETLASQHNGAGNYKEVGIVLQRSLLILGLMTVPLMILWLYVYDLFSALGIDLNVCHVIQTYLNIRVLCIPVDVFNACYEQYLMSIGVVKPSMWAYIFLNLSILALSYSFVDLWHLPYECLGWAWVISMYLSGVVQVFCSLPYHEVQRTLQLSWHPLALTEWWEFLELGLPGAVMTCSEWWAFEILTLFASLLSTKAAAVQSILMQTISLTFMIPLGIGIACTALVGNAMGAQYVHLAKSIGSISIYFVLVIQCLLAVILWLGGHYLVSIFTTDRDVQAMASHSMPYLSLFIIFDGLQCIISSILRGTGKQYVGAVINVVAFYGVGLPCAYWLCFQWQYGLDGLLLGITTGGSLLQCCVLVGCIFGYENFMYSTVIHPHEHEGGVSEEEKKTSSVVPSYQSLSQSDV